VPYGLEPWDVCGCGAFVFSGNARRHPRIAYQALAVETQFFIETSRVGVEANTAGITILA
jgi:hypothetical protein